MQRSRSYNSRRRLQRELSSYSFSPEGYVCSGQAAANSAEPRGIDCAVVLNFLQTLRIPIWNSFPFDTPEWDARAGALEFKRLFSLARDLLS